MVTKDIITKAHHCFRDVNPDVWTDLAIYVGQVEYEVVALKQQLASKEQELAEVNALVSDAVKAMEILTKQARLQRAIDRIKKAGYVPNLGYSVEYGGIFEVEVTVRAFGPPGDEWRLGEEHLFCAFSDAEAAEQAADWAESQKDPAHE